MAVERTETRWRYKGDGATKDFAYKNVIWAKSDIAVFRDGAQVPEPEYSVSNIGQETGGTVTFTTAPPAPADPTEFNVVLDTQIPDTQPTDLEKVSTLASDVLNRRVDRSARNIQENRTLIDDALRVPPTDEPRNLGIPGYKERANQFQGYDGDGNSIVGQPGSVGEIPVSPYGQGVVSQPNAAGMRAYTAAASQAELDRVAAAIQLANPVGSVRGMYDAVDRSPSHIPLDGRTIGNAASGAQVANDGLEDLFNIAKAYAPNTGNEVFANGDTVTLFDLQGRTIVCAGQGTGLSLRQIGEQFGAETPATATVQSGTGETVAAATAGSNMQPSHVLGYEVFSGVLPDGQQLAGFQLAIQWIAGGWADATAYKRNDALRSPATVPGVSYVCLQDHTSVKADNEPGAGTNWQSFWAEMNFDGLQGVPGGVGNWTGPWSNTQPYVVNEAVQHNGSSWIANAPSVGKEPGVAPEWDLQAAKGDPGAPGDVSAPAVQDGRHLYLKNVGGTGGAITAQATPTLTAWAPGQKVRWKVVNSNPGGGVTMAVDAVAPVSIKDKLGGDPPAGFYQHGEMAEALFDGTSLIDLTIPTQGLPPGFQFGVKLVINATDPNNDIDFTPGSVASDTFDADLVLAALLTKRLDANWAVGSGNGGLDTGTKQNNQWYDAYLIKRSDTGVVDAIFTTQGSGPQMPANYDQKRWRFPFKTDGSGNILHLTQVGKEFFWTIIPPLDINIAPGTSGTTYTLVSVPPGHSVLAKMNVGFGFGASGDQVYLMPPFVTSQAPGLTTSPLATQSQQAVTSTGQNEVMTDASAQIHARSDSASLVLRVAVLSWVDPRLGDQ